MPNAAELSSSSSSSVPRRVPRRRAVKRRQRDHSPSGPISSNQSSRDDMVPSYLQTMVSHPEKHIRGKSIALKDTASKPLRTRLQRVEERIHGAESNAVRSDMLLSESQGRLEVEGAEQTKRVKQRDIAQNVDAQSRRKIFDIMLESGPYRHDFTRNGRFVCLGGEQGHVALVDLFTYKPKCEFRLQDRVYDVKYLHNEQMFAVAQRKYCYIYDDYGTEIHCLRNHLHPLALEYLPYHYLLSSVGKNGILKYQDVSTGSLVAEWKTKLGDCHVMRQNPYNAVVCLGHKNGRVTMWSPTISEPLVTMLCHSGPINALAVDSKGLYLTTAGLDGKVKVWDVRTYRELHCYRSASPVDAIDISQQGMLALGFGTHCEIWDNAFVQKARAPYMTHQLSSGCGIRDVHFRPYEDVLGLSHVRGFSSVLIPGSGDPNFDSFETNPFESKRQRRESEVYSVLEKLQPSMISLNPNVIGSLSQDHNVTQRGRRLLSDAVNQLASGEDANTSQPSRRRKGKGIRRLLRKNKNVIDSRKVSAREKLIRMKKERESADREKANSFDSGALSRFFNQR